MPVTLLHWNIETYGPAKNRNANHPNFVNYIARLVTNTNADIFAMVEVKNSTSLIVPPLIATAINTIEGIAAHDNPWRWVIADSGFNSEAYVMMYRIDRDLLPVRLTRAGFDAGPNTIPDHGLGRYDADNLELQFPSRWTGRGGRRPFYATFMTGGINDERTFSVISYHAMFGAHTARGVRRVPFLNVVTEFPNDPYDDLDFSLISGDFNVDFDNNNRADYQYMLNLPSYQATNDRTSMQNNPAGGNDPATFMANAYDNIFQTYPEMAPTGQVVNLMVQSAVVPAPQPPLPAAQPNVGNLSAEAGAFNIAALNHYLARIANPIVALPPNDMDTSWDFVREAISNHYPVVTTVDT